MKNLFYSLVICSFLVLQGCGGSSEGSDDPKNGSNNGQEDAVSVETLTATARDIWEQVKSFGNIRSQEIVKVTPQVTNRVTQVYADLGDTVRQGQTLAKIYAVPFRDQFQQAKSQLEQSRTAYVRDSLQFYRQKELYKKDLISSSEFENAKATFLNSKAQYESSKANLSQSRESFKNTNITSPVYGVVLSRNISEGDLASSGQVAYKIGNLTGYEARVFLPLKDWEKVEIGQKVNFRVSNQSDISGKGRVTQISPGLDPTTGLGEVVISLTDRDPSIYQGVLVQAVINVATHNNAVVIPRAALIENVQTFIEPESNSIQLQRDYSAFVVKNDTTAIRRKLKLGIEQGSKIEILEGINAGDEVVITGQNNLDDSTKVQVVEQQNLQESPDIPIENTEADSVGTGAETADSSASSSP